MVDLAAGLVKAGFASTDTRDYGLSQDCRKQLVFFLKWLLRRHKKLGGVTEIRAIAERPTKMVWSGYFGPKHVMDLVEQILPDPDGPRPKIPYGDTPRIGEAQFYFTMQPANPDLLARSAYTLGRCEATSDKDIIAYHLFAVDLDPVRLSGISSTDDEKAEARKVGRKVGNWLKKRGIGFILADSGNGYHLLVPTVPYKDVAQASANAHTLLKLLQKQSSTDKVSIDTTIYNPSRILKLYGTKAVKGSDLPERPHRYATVDLSDIPEDVDLFGVLHQELDAFRKTSEATAKVPSAKAISSNGKSLSAPGGWDFDTCSKILQALLTRAGFHFKAKDKGGHRIFNFQDCPYHTDPDGQHYECAVMVRAEGGFAAKCMHDEEAGWKDFKAKIGWETHIGDVLDKLGIPRGTSQYQATTGGIIHLKPSKDGTVKVPLTNFTAKIAKDIVEDDGIETKHVFEIEAVLQDRSTRFRVSAQEFASMSWPLEYLGAQAVIQAGLGTRDHVRVAIQLLSGEIPTEKVYTHTGWRKHEGRWVYLYAGGAIGSHGEEDGQLLQNIRVRLPKPLAEYRLPKPNMGMQLIRAISKAMKLLTVAPKRVTIPLFAAVWRAVLGDTDFSLFPVGPTGAGKSELAALFQRFWGAGMDARHLPANWLSTANTNEALAFHAKDALITVDDFAPTGGQFNIAKQHGEADRLLRGQGNSSGRGRMRADTSLRHAKPPRGLILATGEDAPRGVSLRARMLVLEISPGDLDWKAVMESQEDASEGVYALALAGFISWMAGQYETIQRKRRRRVKQLREKASTSGQHKRTLAVVADLFFGLEIFTEFAVDVAALTKKQAKNLLNNGWNILGEVASTQTEIQAGSDPAQRFLELLNAALSCGKAHVAGKNGQPPPDASCWGWRAGENAAALGLCVGWVDGPHLYVAWLYSPLSAHLRAWTCLLCEKLAK